MPDELASEARRRGNACRAASNREICSELIESSGSSDETKWLISRSAPLAAPYRSIASRRSESESKPSRLMPVSRCRAQALGAPRRLRQARPALELPFASDHRLQAMFGVVRRIGAGLEAVQDINLRLIGQQAPRGKTLAEMGDEEGAGARGPQRRRRPVEADSIGVRLHHRRASSGRRAFGEPAPIVGERDEVDRETARGAVRWDEISHESRFSITATVGASNPSCVSTPTRRNPRRSNRRSFSGRASRTRSVMRGEAAPPRRVLARLEQPAAQPLAPPFRQDGDARDMERVAGDLPQRQPREPPLDPGAEASAVLDLLGDRGGGLAQRRGRRMGRPGLGSESGADDLGGDGGVGDASAAAGPSASATRSARGREDVMPRQPYTRPGRRRKAGNASAISRQATRTEAAQSLVHERTLTSLFIHTLPPRLAFAAVAGNEPARAGDRGERSRWHGQNPDAKGGAEGRRGGRARSRSSPARSRALRRRFGRDPRPLVVRRPRAAARLPAFFLRQPGRADRRPPVAADHRHQRQPDLRHLRHAQHLQLEGQRRGRHGRDLRHADDRQRRRARFGLWAARAIGARFRRQARLSLPAEARGALRRRIRE